MAEATRGPYRVGYLDKNGQRVVEAEHIEICTCWHHSVGAIEQEMEANAHLLAASWEMREALRGLLIASVPEEDGSYWREIPAPNDEQWQAAETALAKADGNG